MQNQQAERFTFTDDRSDTKIVFLPQILRGNRRIPQLDYQGLEGKFTFRGDEIKLQQSNLGLLICITLKNNTETESVDFALVLPSVNLRTQKRQDFETVAIATTRKKKPSPTKMEFNLIASLCLSKAVLKIYRWLD